MHKPTRYTHAALLALLLCLSATTSPASAGTTTYDEITVTITEPSRSASTNTGYLCYPVTIENRSTSERSVSIIATGNPRSFSSAVATRLSVSTAVGPESTVQTAIYLPPAEFAGTEAIVSIDGRIQQAAVAMGFSSHAPRVVSRWYGSTGTNILAFSSAGVRTDIRDALERAAEATPKLDTLAIVRAEQETTEWLGEWLAYSRFGLVLVSAAEWVAAPSPVREALAAYTRAGGLLVVAGEGVALEDVIGHRPKAPSQALHPVGFGHVCVGTDDAVEAQALDIARLTHRKFMERPSFDAVDAERTLSVSPDESLPVVGVLAILIIAAFLIGPVNIIIMAKLRRRAMLLFTTPVIGLAFAGLTFLAGILHDGIEAKVKSRSITLLDHRVNRATTITHWSCYAPLPPGDGISARADIEVTPLGQDSFSENPLSFTLDRGERQIFRGGLIRSRIPTHLLLTTDEPRRERVEITVEGDTTYATNGLGVPIETLAYADPAGAIFTAADITPGARAAMIQASDNTIETMESTRSVSSREAVARRVNDLRENGINRVPTNGYIAVLAQDPFLDITIGAEDNRDDIAVVIGRFEEPTQ